MMAPLARNREEKQRELSAALLKKQIELIYENLSSSLVVTLIVSVLTAVFYRAETQPVLLLSWLLAMHGIVLLRFIGLRQYRLRPDSRSVAEWYRLFIHGSWAAALIWGNTAFIFFPSDNMLYQALLAFLMTGVAVVG
ncbi:MAG: hypothetical protein ABFR65_08225, partial [Pseudomonadota bacterium]